MPSSFGGALPKNPRRRVNQAMRWLQNLHGTMSSSKKGRPSSPNTPPQPQISACEKCGLSSFSPSGAAFCVIPSTAAKQYEVVTQSKNPLQTFSPAGSQSEAKLYNPCLL